MWVVTIFKEHKTEYECFHSKLEAQNFIHYIKIAHKNEDWCYMLNYSRPF